MKKSPGLAVGLLALTGISYLALREDPRYLDYKECRDGRRNLATALEMYSSDNRGQYPAHLGQLLPGGYLQRIPRCPAAGNSDYTYEVHSHPDGFTLRCGFPHPASLRKRYRAEVGPDWEDGGLLDHP